MSELTFQDPKKKFCEMLVEARTSKNLDISRISEKSKIAQPYLERIEAGEWDFLPHAYVRAFLRTYVQILGLNVEEMLSQFDEIVDEPPVPIPGRMKEEERERDRLRKGEPKVRRRRLDDEEEILDRKPLTFTLAGEGSTAEPMPRRGDENGGNSTIWVIGLIAAAAVVAALLFWPREQGSVTTEEIPFEEVVKEHEEMVADVPAEPTDELVAAAQEELAEQGAILEEEIKEEITLVTQATQRCYIRITADQEDVALADIVLEQGMSRTYFADSLFSVVIGNAAGMKLILNGNDMGGLGEEGRVVTVILDKNGIRRLRLGVLRPPSDAKDKENADTLKPQPFEEEELVPRTVRGRTPTPAAEPEEPPAEE